MVLGTQDTYEAPLNPEVRIDTAQAAASEAAGMILKAVNERLA